MGWLSKLFMKDVEEEIMIEESNDINKTCEHCYNYKKRGVNIGFCKEKTKIVKASSKEDCFKLENDIINKVEEINELPERIEPINNYKKIIIRDGKKIYI
jgi:hypothetical protein